MSEQLRDDMQRIYKPRQETVGEWLADLARRKSARDHWEDDALERVLPYLLGVCIAGRAIVSFSDDEAVEQLRESLRFLQAPIGWLRDD